MTTNSPRLRATERVTGAIWGLIVIGIAVTSMVVMSGYDVDSQMLIVIGLGALGGWLLISALFAIRPRRSRAVEDDEMDEPALAPAESLGSPVDRDDATS